MARTPAPLLLLAAMSLGGCAHAPHPGTPSAAAAPQASCSLPSELNVDCACTTPDCLLKLGYIYAEAIDVPRDERRARALYRRACAGGSTLACNNLGSLLVEGRGGGADPRAGADLYESACRQHSAFACGNLATLYLDGRGRAQNEQSAALLFQEACNEGVARACAGLAMLYVRGNGVPVDVQQSLRLFERACDEGEASACEAVSMFSRAESLGALEKYLRGMHARCGAGDRSACVQLQ